MILAITSDPVSLLLNFGVGGVLALLLATQYLVPKPTYQSVLKDRDEARAELAAAQAALLARQDTYVPRADYQVLHDELTKLRSKMEDDIFPGVFRATDTLDRTMAVLGRMAERAPL